MASIFEKNVADIIIPSATFEYREWHTLAETIPESDVSKSAEESSSIIRNTLKEIKDSLSLFEDPEYSGVTYKTDIFKWNQIIQENYQILLGCPFDDEGLRIIKENKPSDYVLLFEQSWNKYEEILRILKEGTNLSDFSRFEGFSIRLNRMDLSYNKRHSKNEEQFVELCVRDVWEHSLIAFCQYVSLDSIERNYPTLKNRVCEAVYNKFKENPDLLDENL